MRGAAGLMGAGCCVVVLECALRGSRESDSFMPSENTEFMGCWLGDVC